MKGKLIVIEGTDCSGKETQTNRLVEYLQSKKQKVVKYSFPMYDTPTGKIIGGPFLGKEQICDGWFKETAPKVDGKVACLYYAADRLYNIDKIKEKLKSGYIVILDRYVESNMAHQGGKIANEMERYQRYKFIETLEYELLQLPRPDAIILLYMPYENAKVLRLNRTEKPDENESSDFHLKCAEKAYLELAELYNYYVVNCAKDEEIRSIDDIASDVQNVIEDILK